MIETKAQDILNYLMKDKIKLESILHHHVGKDLGRN